MIILKWSSNFTNYEAASLTPGGSFCVTKASGLIVACQWVSLFACQVDPAQIINCGTPAHYTSETWAFK